jgi:glycolate oxidase
MIILETQDYDEFCRLAERLSTVCTAMGAVDIFVPGSESAKRNLFDIREKFQPAYKHMVFFDTIDVVVPRKNIADFVRQIKLISQKYRIPISACGHAGDGNVHLHPLGKTPDTETARNLRREVYLAGINMGGTLSGEHGLGFDKKDYFALAASETTILLMQRIKQAFDPNLILNPGKIAD